MKKALLNSLKNFSFLIILLALQSCNNSNGLNGKKYYILNGTINYNNYYISLKEIELNFISNDMLEAKLTFYADDMGYQIVGDTSELRDSKILKYKYENEIFELPEYKVLSRVKFDNQNTNVGEAECFFSTSIVSLLDTKEASERIKNNSKKEYTDIFLSFLQRPYKPLLKKQGNQIIYSAPDKKEPEIIEYEENKGNPKAMMRDTDQTKEDSDIKVPFTGTKKFCEDVNTESWYYIVSITGNKITLKLYPGLENNYYKEIQKPLQTIFGTIVNGKIITKDTLNYLTNRFRFDNDKLIEINNEGGDNVYQECQIN